MDNWLGLRGRVAVVTGATGGLGRAIAAGLAEAGVRLALLDRQQQAADEAAGEIQGRRGEAIGIACDVSQPDSVEAASRQVQERLGSCDILVNNAAVLRPGALDTLSLADWNAMLSVNLTGYFLCAQVFGRGMLDRGRAASCTSPPSRRAIRKERAAPIARARQPRRCSHSNSRQSGARAASAAMWSRPE